jgi:hypothetical protein
MVAGLSVVNRPLVLQPPALPLNIMTIMVKSPEELKPMAPKLSLLIRQQFNLVKDAKFPQA